MVGTVDYVRGLDTHPNRGMDPTVRNAISLIRRTNTRRPPDRISSSDDSDRQADSEGPCHTFPSSSDSPEEQEYYHVVAAEDVPTFKDILAIIIARDKEAESLPPTRGSMGLGGGPNTNRIRSSTRNNFLEAAPNNQDRQGHGNPDKKVRTFDDLKEYIRRRAQDRDRRLGGQEVNDSDK